MSDLSLSSIKRGLEDLKDLGKVETTFQIQGHTITLRTFGRPENEAVQLEAAQYLDENTNAATVLPYLNAQKYESLARAIVQIDDMDLRNVDTIEDEDGNDLDKTYVIKDILETWDSRIVEACWNKYEDLLEKSKERIFDEVEFMDREELLEEHEQRVEELRDELDKPPLTEDTSEDAEEDVDDLERDDVKDMVFNPDQAPEDVEFGDVEEAKQAEAEAASQVPGGGDLPEQQQGGSQQPQGQPPSDDREIYDPMDPDRELTEQEKKRLEAEEQEFLRRQQQQQQQGGSQQPRGQQSRQQKQQPQGSQQPGQQRERLNQQNPQIRQDDPRAAQNQPTHLDDGDAPDEDDFVETGTQHLGPDT